jgi:hypothetical protein
MTSSIIVIIFHFLFIDLKRTLWESNSIWIVRHWMAAIAYISKRNA